MALLPQTKRDQTTFAIGFVAAVLAVAFYLYPYSAREEQYVASNSRFVQMEGANQRAAREFASGSIESLRAQAAENRSTLVVMRRLVPTGQEVPALLEEVSTAARRAGLDVGSVTPEAMIPGDRFNTYRYTITILGGYHQFGAFLANIGSLARIVAPVNFSIIAGSAARGPMQSLIKSVDKGTLASTITLQTYVERTEPTKAAIARERTS